MFKLYAHGLTSERCGADFRLAVAKVPKSGVDIDKYYARARNYSCTLLLIPF